MSVFNEFFSAELVDQLFRDNKFMDYFTNHSEFLSSKTVHLSNYNNDPTIYVDDQPIGGGAVYDYGFAAATTTEVDLTYQISSYKFEPIRCTDFDEMLTKYSKFQAITKNSLNKLSQVVGDSLLEKVGGSAGIEVIDTTGADGTGNSIFGENKKKVSYADFLALAKAFDKSNIKGERFILMPADMYWELLDSDNDAVRNALNYGTATLPEGVVNKIAGINIMTRSEVICTDGSGVVKPLVDAATGDAHASLAWVTESVSAAWSSPTIYSNSGVAQLYGNVVSGEIAMGASKSRSDAKGIIILEQGAIV